MITAFEVGSVFRIIDEASPALRLILRQVRELNLALDKALQPRLTSPSIAGITRNISGPSRNACGWIYWRERLKIRAKVNDGRP